MDTQSMLLHNTPIERYGEVWVKREDLCAPHPLPPLAKLRGVEVLLNRLAEQGVKVVGHHDSWYSKAGQGVAIISQRLGMKCVIGYPEHKDVLNGQLVLAKAYGALLHPVRPNFIRVNYLQTKKYVESVGGTMLPFALACPETTIAVSEEAKLVPHDLCTGSLVICAGSGTILSGVIAGLPFLPDIYAVSAGMSEANQLKNLHQLLLLAEYMGREWRSKLHIIPPLFAYEYEDNYPCSFPSHPNYDRKAWRWLNENIAELKQPILFWNIGA